MSKFRFAEGLKVQPVLAPVDAAASAQVTAFVDCNYLHWLTFVIPFGNCTSDDTDVIAITVRCSTEDTSATTEPMAIPFWYRVTSAVATDSTTDIIAGTSDGIGTSDDGINAANLDSKVMIIDVDPAVVAAKAATSGSNRWVSVNLAPVGPISILGAIAVGEPRYPGANQPSST
jgi:hypothetical protein